MVNVVLPSMDFSDVNMVYSAASMDFVVPSPNMKEM
ncbi:hypothetical protein BVRB_040680 [Beta vulgaris subsp. vulgaris]|uniref:Uncharacterized protein n=1 Tax=Beta vulgaris subsp. vulgaris TaxID=3555 RepID=A0A0J7YN00_BETVV|nr:hypothetical protein BVRB_040680 [Beta vulgaris subsp. vulgaris]